MQIFLCLVMGYATGNINPAYILSRLKGFDIREKGTGNAGASNVTVVMGKKAGLFTALFDIFKAFAVSEIAAGLFPLTESAGIITGVSCIIGHMFPAVMKFRGGKGLACLAGTILSFSPTVFLCLLLAEAAAAFLSDYICVVAPSGSVIFTITYFMLTSDYAGTLLLALTSVVIIFKHIENFRRIRSRQETHISYLWKKQ